MQAKQSTVLAKAELSGVLSRLGLVKLCAVEAKPSYAVISDGFVTRTTAW